MVISSIKSKLLVPLDKVKIYFQNLFSNKSSIDNLNERNAIVNDLYLIQQGNKYGFIKH